MIPEGGGRHPQIWRRQGGGAELAALREVFEAARIVLEVARRLGARDPGGRTDLGRLGLSGQLRLPWVIGGF